MDDKQQQQLTDSEIQKLRNEISEAERRRWLLRLVRTGAAWIVGTLAAALSLVNGALDLVEWVTKK
jgi:hypothetical protein